MDDLSFRKLGRKSCGIRTFLIFLAVFPNISHQDENLQASCLVLQGNSVFVNTTGKDFSACGTPERPCLTISYAVSRAVDENFPSVLINISSGVYKEMDSIKLDCSRRILQRISLWGERQDEKVVQVAFSLDVQFCEINLVNLHWTSVGLVVHNVLLSNLTICKCTAQQTDISVIGSSSNILLQDSSISNSLAFKQNFMLPLLLVTSLPGYQSTMQITHCNFSDNVGPIIFAGNVHQASIINSLFKANKAVADGSIITSQFSHLSVSTTKFLWNSGSLLEIENSGSLNLQECLFQGNKVLDGSVITMEGLSKAEVKDCVFQKSSSYKEGPVIRIKDGYASASVEKCHFSCNLVNSSVFHPPVMSHSVHQVSCDNCTVDHSCPVHCSPGEFLTSGILCMPCPVGSYSPGIVRNKTVLNCVSCPAGTYSSKEKSKICTLCAQDTFSSKAGSASCTKCKNDLLTSDPGQASCSKLSIGLIILIVLVSLFIAVPVLILLLRQREANKKDKGSSCVSHGMHSPLLRKRKKTRLSINSDDVDGDNFSWNVNLTTSRTCH